MEPSTTASLAQPNFTDLAPRSPGKMRGGNGRPRPSSQHGTAPHARANNLAGRKIFNCIIDDTALVAGVKKSTRNGIRQWVGQGQIRLFVPLHALEQLNKQKGAQTRHGEDVRETLRWLDDATSRESNPIALQAADNHFETWAEVEKFAVPRTLFSEHDGLDAEPEVEVEDTLDQDLNARLLLDITRKTPASSAASAGSRSLSPSSMRSQRSSLNTLSPPTSPIKPSPPLSRSEPTRHDEGVSSSASVPARLQPLFNYILWRIHERPNPVPDLESYIFLCNDQSKINYAKGFEVKTKRLEQLRDAISRQDRDLKSNSVNPPAVGGGAVTNSKTSPPTAPAAMIPAATSPTNVMDPDAFDRRDSTLTGQSPDGWSAQRSPQPQKAFPAAGRGRGLPFAPRGGQRGNTFRGGPRGRGNSGAPGRGNLAPQSRAEGNFAHGQIDPNSFVRPRGNGFAGRGGRKLWTPS